MINTRKTTIHFVRHGDVMNPGKILYRRLPRYRLSRLGVAEAKAVAQTLLDEQKPIVALFHSPILAARQTARQIAQMHDLPPRASALLNDALTPHEGEKYAKLEELDWDLYKDLPVGYETSEDIVRRVKNFCSRVLRSHAGRSVVAVTHGEVVLHAQLWAMDKTLSHANLMAVDEYPRTGSITTLSFKSTGATPNLSYHVPQLPQQSDNASHK